MGENALFFEPDNEPLIDLSLYCGFIIFFSSGKDSTACVLHLLEQGVDPNLIELHHHCVDGQEGSTLMDWPITESYTEKIAQALNLKLFWSFRQGGFEREMLRENQRTGAIYFQDEQFQFQKTGGIRGALNTRLKFPQVAADLRTRWCSGYLKVDVGARLITSQERFTQGKYLVITGERAEESSARAKYEVFEPHRTDNRNGKRVQRYIDHWRPVHAWPESQVWAIIERWKITAHPAYYCGWGRCSCFSCIFGSANQWATIKKYAPEHFERIAHYEQQFGVTIHRKLSVYEQAEKGTPYDIDPRWIKIAMATEFNEPLFKANWELPAGAYGESAGPT